MPSADISGTRSAFDDDTTGAGPFGIHFFTAVDGRAVAWDITLDGNTFKDSHSVDREIFVADVMAGIVVDYGRTRASYSYIYRTRQFKTQGKDQIFGTVSITYSY